MKNSRLAKICFLAVSALCVLSAAAATITLDLETVPSTACDVEWVEAGIPLWFGSTTPEDFYWSLVPSPTCNVINASLSNGGRTGPYYGPARLIADLSGVGGIQTIEIDLYEAHDPGSTRAFVYDAGGSSLESAFSFADQNQTLTLTPGGAHVETLAISAQESAVWEIRLIGDGLVGTGLTTFGAIKSIYR